MHLSSSELLLEFHQLHSADSLTLLILWYMAVELNNSPYLGCAMWTGFPPSTTGRLVRSRQTSPNIVASGWSTDGIWSGLGGQRDATAMKLTASHLVLNPQALTYLHIYMNTYIFVYVYIHKCI